MNSDLIKYQNGKTPGRPDNSVVDVGEIIEVGNPLKLRQALQLLAERWWLILLVAFCGAAGAAFFASRIPVKYSAKAVLQVDQEVQRLIKIDELGGQDLRTSEMLNTIVQNIKNTSVLRRVVRANNLLEDPQFLPGKANLTEDRLIKALSGMVNVKLRQETRLIDITVQHVHAPLAEKLANSVAEEFIRQSLDQRFSTTQAANELLYEEAARLKAKLELSEKLIQDYKETNKTVSMEEHQNIVSEKLRELNRNYTLAKADRLRLEADYRRMEILAVSPDALLALPGVQLDPAVSDLRRKIVEQEAIVATLGMRYKSKYPKMAQAQQQLDDLKNTLRLVASRAPESAKAAYEDALSREKNLESALQETQLEALEHDKKAIQFHVLQRELQSDRELYDSVLKRLKETDLLSKGLERAAIAVVEPASSPATAIQPPTALITVAAFVLALIGAFGLLYVERLADNSIQTVDQAEECLQLPVWAALPKAPAGANHAVRHIIFEEPHSLCTEGFRTLRTTTALADRSHSGKVLLFTSADPGEGKSFCSVNHALCNAQQGKRVLLIDLDLRRPKIGESFGFPPDTPGASDVLLGKGSLEKLACDTVYPNVQVLPAGRSVPNPAELLASEAVGQLLLEAQFTYDSVVIDTAPINAVSDTLLLLPHAGKVCLVVRAGRTPRRAIQRAITLMERAGVLPSGIVLNFLPMRSGNGYFYHYGPKENYGRQIEESQSKKLIST